MPASVDFEESYHSWYLSTAVSIANILGMAITMPPAAHPEISVKTTFSSNRRAQREKASRLLDIRCQLPGINAKGDLLNPFSDTPLRSHRVLPMDNTDAVLFRRGPLLYKDKLLLKILVLTD